MEEILRQVFSFVCGQDPGHTWFPGGELLPFCQRCTGFFAGSLVAVVLQVFLRPRPGSRYLQVHGLFLIQMIPLGFHLVPQDAVLRTLSGQLFGMGVVSFLFLLPSGFRDRPLESSRWRTVLYAISSILSLLALPALASRGGPLLGSALSWMGLAGLAALAGLALANGALLARAALSIFLERPGKRIPA